jgi:multiple sugar transport system permease protein
MGRRFPFLRFSILVLWSLVCLFPLYWMLLTSLKSDADFITGPRYIPYLDFTPDFHAWSFILFEAQDGFYWRFVNSLLIALSAAALALCSGTMLVYGATRLLSRHWWLQSKFLIPAMIATRILPPLVVALPIYVMAKAFNVLDTKALLILVYAAVHVPVVAWLCVPVIGFKRSEQEDAALLEGASNFLIFRSIVVPMTAAGLFAIGAIVFVLCWNEYILAVFLTSDNALTLPPFLMGQMSVKEAAAGAESQEWGKFSAASIIMVLPVMALTGFALSLLRRLPPTTTT